MLHLCWEVGCTDKKKQKVVKHHLAIDLPYAVKGGHVMTVFRGIIQR